MSAGKPPPLALRASGPLACFTRPELKTERVSYQVITPSAARGLLEAVLWKPAICWRVERIKVLSRPRWIGLRRNEVNNRAAKPADRLIRSGGVAPVLLADTDRAQRNTVALVDVDYVIEARFDMTDRAGAGDNRAKFVDMFRRRVERGQHYHTPYFGCREFVADVRQVDDRTPPPIDESRDLGMMLFDIEFGDQNRPYFFHARMEKGVVEVPHPSDVFGAKGGVP